MRRQRGVALITVLLVLAIIVVLAANMANRLGINIRRTGNQIGEHQAYFYALSGEAYARLALHRLLKKNDGILVAGGDWSKAQKFPVPGGSIAGHIVDGRNCFNLNSLGGNKQDVKAHKAQFIALLTLQGIERYQAETIAASLADWLDADDRLQSSLGAEDAEYQGHKVPYLAANGPMTDKSELRMVKGVSAELYQKIAPDVCVLDNASNQLNINTLPANKAVLLAALLTPMPLDSAEAVLASRPAKGYASKEAFWQGPAVSKLHNLQAGAQESIVIKSDRFFVQLEGRFQGRPAYMESALKKNDNNNLTVLWRRLGGRL